MLAAVPCLASPPQPAPSPARPDPAGLGLNPEQLAAVTHGDAPLLVLAGAGTGKTGTLAARVAHLVQSGTDPQRLMLLTFTRRAAAEMVHRAGLALQQALQPSSPGPAGLRTAAPVDAAWLPWAGTFHSVGARLLRRHGRAIGLPEDFSVLDRADAEELMAWQREALGLARTEGRRRAPLAATCLGIYSRVLNTERPLSDVLGEAYPWCLGWEPELQALFSAYEQAKAGQHLLDYDDLLVEWAELLAHPQVGPDLRARFVHVLVDEYQDSNRLQARILRGLKPGGRGLTVVGDDAQSIYAFRGADWRNILDFAAQCEMPARVLTLTRNYRATQPLLDAANAVIGLAAEGHRKALWTERQAGEAPWLVAVDDEAAQARWVADQVLARREGGLRLKQQAVLFRTGHHSAALELELLRRNIPFVKYGGLKFLEAAHVKDLLALLRWLQNPHAGLAVFRALRLLPGIGPAHARRAVDWLAAAEDPWAAWDQLPPPPGCAPSDWQGLQAVLARLRQGEAGAWPAEVGVLVDWYAPHLARLHDHPEPRLADLRQLAALAGQARHRDRFLTELALDPAAASSDEAGDPSIDEDYLILSTLHAAKGQEWQSVMLLNVVDGCLPGDLSTATVAQLEEERRLLYVGMTRARSHLSLLVPRRFHVTQQARHGDRHVLASRSRFLPEAILGHFQQAPAPVAAATRPPDRSGHTATPLTDPWLAELTLNAQAPAERARRRGARWA